MLCAWVFGIEGFGEQSADFRFLASSGRNYMLLSQPGSLDMCQVTMPAL